MNRLNLPLRRALVVAAGAVIGVVGALAVPAPAQAHHPVISGTDACDQKTGERIITWTVTHSEDDKDATLVEVTADPATEVSALEGAVLAARGRQGDSVTGEQRVPGGTAEAKLTVKMRWHKGDEVKYEASREHSIDLGSEPCTPTPVCVDKGEARYSHTFDGPKGSATVKLDGDLPLCEGQKQWFTLVSYFAPRPQFATPQYVHGEPDSDWIGGSQRAIDLKVEIPDCNTQVDLIWGGRDEVIDPIVENGPRYGDKKLGSPGAPGNRSSGPKGWFNGGTRNCVQPAVEFTSSCDGSVRVHLSNNGAISRYPVDFVVTGEGGWSKTVTVQPGKADNDTVVPPSAAGKVVVTVDGKQVEDGSYSWKRPATCAPPTVNVGADCDTVTVTVANPAGSTPVTANVAYGQQRASLTVPAGAKKSTTFDAGTAGFATVTFAGLDMAPLRAVVEAAGRCGGGGLVVTGADAGTAAAVGLGLLLAGGAVLMIVRRRRVTFTA